MRITLLTILIILAYVSSKASVKMMNSLNQSLKQKLLIRNLQNQAMKIILKDQEQKQVDTDLKQTQSIILKSEQKITIDGEDFDGASIKKMMNFTKNLMTLCGEDFSQCDFKKVQQQQRFKQNTQKSAKLLQKKNKPVQHKNFQLQPRFRQVQQHMHFETVESLKKKLDSNPRLKNALIAKEHMRTWADDAAEMTRIQKLIH